MSVKAITNLNLKYLVDQLKSTFFVGKDEKGVPSGVATLDANGKVPASQISVTTNLVVGTIVKNLVEGRNVINGSDVTQSASEDIVFIDLKIFDGTEAVIIPYSTQVSLSGDTKGYVVNVPNGYTTLKAHATYSKNGSGGSSGEGDKNFIYNVSSPSRVLSVAHNLNKLPSVTAINQSGNQVLAEVTYVDNNTVTLNFASDFTGTIIFN